LFFKYGAVFRIFCPHFETHFFKNADKNVGLFNPALDFFSMFQLRISRNWAFERDGLARWCFADAKKLSRPLQTLGGVIEQIILFVMPSNRDSESQLAEFLRNGLRVLYPELDLNLFH